MLHKKSNQIPSEEILIRRAKNYTQFKKQIEKKFFKKFLIQ